jgi:hypothetical protein
MVVFKVHQARTNSFTSTPSELDHGIHSLMPHKGMYKALVQELTSILHCLVQNSLINT